MRRFRWFRFGTRHDVERDLSDEIGHHLERTIARLTAEGWPLPAAEREAYRRFGDVNDYRRRLRRLDEERLDMEGRKERFQEAIRDLRQGLRSVRREPALTLGIALTLALGIGANTTMYGIVDRLLLTPPEHVDDVDSLRRIGSRVRFNDNEYFGFSWQYNDYLDYRGLDEFAEVAAFDHAELTLGYGRNARRVRAGVGSASLFPLLGVEASRGRFFDEHDDRVGGPPVAVVSHEFWRGALAADPEVIGHVLTLGEIDYTVIGVAPAGFTGIHLDRVDVWLPLHVATPYLKPDVDLSGSRNPDWRIYWLEVVGRLAPGTTDVQALAAADAINESVQPDTERFVREVDFGVITGSRAPRAADDPVLSDASKVSLWLSGVSAVVLLVACANVANMLLVRSLRRQGELGVRLALGIPRGRLLRQLLLESSLMALLGGLLAVAVAQGAGGVIRNALFPDVLWTRSVLDPAMLGFTAGLALLTGLLAGILPALQWSRQDVVTTLRSATRGATERSRTRALLLVAQAGFSAVLLIGAGLFIRSLGEVRAIDLGIDDPGSLVMAVPERSQAAAAIEEFTWPAASVLERLERQPGIAAAAAGITAPFGNSWAIGLSFEGRADETLPTAPSGPYVNPVSPGYFRVLGLEVVGGRALEPTDREGAPRVAVVNRAMAELYWPGASPLGACMYVGQQTAETAECTTVVGVVENAHRQTVTEEESDIQYYVPMEQLPLDDEITFLLRLRPEAARASTVRAVRNEILDWAPDTVRHVEVEMLQDRIDPQARAWQMGANLFTVFGGLALVVAAIGLYGVLAFDVAQRTREIGVRSALGAPAGSLRSMILVSGIRVAAVGVVLGVIGALLLGPSIEELLFRVSPRDPMVFGLVAALLLTVAAAASWLPALRATRVDPNVALHD